MTAAPSSADEALARYRVDVAYCFRQTRTKLVAACATAEDLKPLAVILRGDLMESIVFKKVCRWLEGRGKSASAPSELDVRRTILFHVSRELERRGQGRLVSALARACRPTSAG